MEQKRFKNFIAFTLAEMMIVLCIIAVLSAVTLPNFIGKKSTKKIDTSSTWQYDYTFTFGDYYKGNNDNTQVVIGYNLSSSDADADLRAGYANTFGDSALLLRRKNILPYATNGRADIAFFDRNGAYNGRIAADSYGNMVIVKNFGNVSTLAQAQTSHSNLLVGLSDNNETKIDTYGNSINNNTVLGVNSLKDSYLEENNIVVGNDINNAYLYKNNVIVGNYAADNSVNPSIQNINDSVIIGGYASGNALANRVDYNSSVNIGYKVDYHNHTKNIKQLINSINIGAASSSDDRVRFNDWYSRNFDNIENIHIGFNAGVKLRPTYNLYGAIDIGSFSGNGSEASINIGTFSGLDESWRDDNYANLGLNIGLYSGYYIFSDGYYMSGKDDYANVNIGSGAGAASKHYHALSRSVNIGYYAGKDTVDDNFGTKFIHGINIGHSAGLYYKGNYGINIGKYSGYNYNKTSSWSSLNSSNINIGSYSTFYQPNTSVTNTVTLGCNGIMLSKSYRMCIGGKYPLKTKSLSTAWDTDGSVSGLNAATFITTPGILAGSEVGWNKTKIVFVSDYLVTKEATMYEFSDKTLKENIQKTKYGIEKLRKIAVKEFNLKGSKIPSIGVIAQELMKIYPNAVTEETNLNDGKKYYAISPDWIIFSMVQALKDVDIAALNLYNELKENKVLLAKESKKVDSLGTRLDKLSDSNKVLKSQLNEIDKMLKVTETK